MKAFDATHYQTLFRRSLHRHATLTQYFRWFQIYERPFTEQRIQNQLAIFSQDVLIQSIFDTAHGVEEYREKLKAYEGSKNAHHVEKVDVAFIDDNTLELNATVLYQGMQQQNKVYNARIGYHAILALQFDDFPVFTEMKLTLQGELESKPYQDAYPANRAASLMHAWLYRMESEKRNASAFRELLANDFELQLSDSQMINTWSQFEAWIEGIGSRIQGSAHSEKELSVVENADGTISMNVLFDWHGLSLEKKPMIATTHHTWIVENDPNERFARIKKMSVKQVIPFQVLEPEHSLG